MLVISAFKNLKVISKLMVNLILNCFENSVVDQKVGCDFSVYFFSGEETEAERKRYLHERFPHFMLFHSFFFTLGLWQVDTNLIYFNIISQMQISFTIGLIDCDMGLSQV